MGHCHLLEQSRLTCTDRNKMTIKKKQKQKSSPFEGSLQKNILGFLCFDFQKLHFPDILEHLSYDDILESPPTVTVWDVLERNRHSLCVSCVGRSREEPALSLRLPLAALSCSW